MFDPYHKWLGIPKDQRPPTLYQLLGITQGEEDVEVIEEAAIRQTTHVRAYQIGAHAQECTRLLNEIAQARTTLTNPAKRKQYDAMLAQKTSAKLAGMPGPANQVTASAPGPKGAELFAELDTPELMPAGKRPLLKTAPARSNKGLINLAIGGGAVAIIAVVLIAVLSGGKPDNQQAQNGDKAKPKEKLNQKKNTDKNVKKDGIVKINKDKINKEKVDAVKKGAVIKAGDRELAAKIIGRYQLNFKEEPPGKHKGSTKWQFTEGRAVENGQDKGTWRVEDGKVIVTYSQNHFGQAVLEFKDDNTLAGKHQQRNGQIFNWVLTRVGTVKGKGDSVVIGPDASKFIGKYQIVHFVGHNPTVQELFLTRFKEVMADGQPRGDWKTDGNKLVLNLAIHNHKGAVLQADGADGLAGEFEARDGNKFQWELKRTRVVPPLEKPLAKVEYLSDLKERRVVASQFRKDGMMSAQPGKDYLIEVDGVRYSHSLFLFPNRQGQSSAFFRLDKEYAFFLADTLVPQGIIPGQTNPYSPLVFEVLGLEDKTWKSLWKSPPRNRCGTSDRVMVPVKGIQSLELRVHCPNENHFCWAVWIEPRLVLPGDGPMAAGPSPLDKLDPAKIAAEDRLEKIPELVAVLKGHKSEIFGLAFAPDSKRLASAGSDGHVFLWDLAGPEPGVGLDLGGTGAPVSSVAFSWDGKKFAFANDRRARIYDVSMNEPKLLQQVDPLKAGAYPGVALSPDGSILAVTDNSGIRSFDLSAGEPKERPILRGLSGHVKTVYFGRNGKWMLAGGADGKGGRVSLWNLPFLKHTSFIAGQQVWHAVISPDEKKMAYGTSAGVVNVTTFPEMKGIWSKKEHRQLTNSVCFAPDGKTLISTEGGFDERGPHYLIWWNAANGDILKKWELPERCSQGVFAPSGMYVALTNHNRKIYILRPRAD